MNAGGITAAIVAALCMGTMGVFSRKTGFTAEVITFFRLFGGSLFLLLFLGVKGNLRHVCSWPGWPVILNGCFLSGFILFYVEAMNYTTMANAIMVLYLAPLIASVFAHLFLKERLNITSVLLICGALFGFAMMLEFNISFAGDSNYLIGMGYALLGLCCYSGFIIINRMINEDIHVYTRTYYQLLVGALCVVPYLFGHLPALSLHNTLWSIGAAFIPGFLGILCAVIALNQLPAATFGTLAYFEPIFVIILGWFIFDERLGALQLGGCAIILCCGIIKGYLSTNSHE
ncbi:DMT family transporter [Desulforhopalus sp. IMCC35007]|uniref:DMT family transporter n=1 Tax=Desulforhopalus sp. IMCC35007 TaxID=2569543 RepID=UPI0010AE4F6A|nr:DMT family transporter [Desulforhopalus sp. IMCC35007]TKB05884.1 DMT family transporter [Desulforhopalus sp. IMCC35007]